MGKANEHQIKWAHNRAFLASIVHDAAYADWMATVAFYAAVHAVEAMFAKDGFHSTNHQIRIETLTRVNKYQQVWRHYSPLYNAAMVSRYDCSGWLPAQDVINILIRRHLISLEQSVMQVARIRPNLPQISFPPPPTAPPPASLPSTV
jgi:hypothetical protein